jgi:uncharacterized protein (TIGR00730 family)
MKRKLPFQPVLKVKRLADIQGEEARFLAGRNSRLHELKRVIRIAYEYIQGFRKLHFVGPTITVFGSARFKEDHRYYQLGMTIGKVIAEEGYTVMTGGGPGIMEAAARGAKSVNGSTVGCNIRLPFEQSPNPYLDVVTNFYYFFVRKVMLVKYSYAYVILPGGFGTLDELTEALTLIQTGKLYDFPVILVGTDYWKGFIRWMESQMIETGTISPSDLKLIHLTDDPEEVRQIIRDMTEKLGIITLNQSKK